VGKSEKHPEIRNRYLRLKKRRGHKIAIIAIARMLLTAIYHILKNNVPYNTELYRNVNFILLIVKLPLSKPFY
jgi:transposase